MIGNTYSDSESEHYDPWPGCIMCMTGCHPSEHYTHCYTISDKFAGFFNLPQNQVMSIGDMELMIINYAKDHGCVDGTLILYNEELWELLEPVNSKKLKFYLLYRYMKKMLKD